MKLKKKINKKGQKNNPIQLELTYQICDSGYKIKITQ